MWQQEIPLRVVFEKTRKATRKKLENWFLTDFVWFCADFIGFHQVNRTKWDGMRKEARGGLLVVNRCLDVARWWYRRKFPYIEDV